MRRTQPPCAEFATGSAPNEFDQRIGQADRSAAMRWEYPWSIRFRRDAEVIDASDVTDA